MINPKTKERELAYVVKIDRIEPIIGSDNCESAIVGGWHIMVRKETFKEGDLAVYFEIDSKLPETDTYVFLAPKHYKVKTQKYTFGGRGNFVSQGLLMHFNDFKDELKKYRYYDANDLCFYEIEEGTFLTKELGVTYSVADDNKRKSTVNKYARMKQRNAKLFVKYNFLNKMYKNNFGKKVLFLFLGRRKDAKASFWPDWVVKTDEERVQNLPQLFPPDNTEWIVTEKIDGTSTTMTMKRKHFNRYDYYVCSRNVCFDKADKECFYETNVYTEMAEKYHLEDVLKDILKRYDNLAFVTIQGETYGKGIQDRDYHMNDIDFKVFNLILGYKTGEVKRLNPKDMTEFLAIYALPCVPIVAEHFTLPNSIDEMVVYADGASVVDGDYREGVVLRTYDGVNSFKAVSNTYLLSKFGNNQ